MLFHQNYSLIVELNPEKLIMLAIHSPEVPLKINYSARGPQLQQN